jgi:hypothetical protein
MVMPWIKNETIANEMPEKIVDDPKPLFIIYPINNIPAGFLYEK